MKLAGARGEEPSLLRRIHDQALRYVEITPKARRLRFKRHHLGSNILEGER